MKETEHLLVDSVLSIAPERHTLARLSYRGTEGAPIYCQIKNFLSQFQSIEHGLQRVHFISVAPDYLFDGRRKEALAITFTDIVDQTKLT